MLWTDTLEGEVRCHPDTGLLNADGILSIE